MGDIFPEEIDEAFWDLIKFIIKAFVFAILMIILLILMILSFLRVKNHLKTLKEIIR